MASEDEVVILGRFRDEVSGGLERVEHQIAKTGHATEELATASEAAAVALERAAAKGDKFRREMRDLERQLNDTTAAEIRLLAAEKAADAARKDPIGTSAQDRVKAEKELAKARAELTVKTKQLADASEHLESRTHNLLRRVQQAATGTRLLTAGLIGLGAVGVSGALAGAAQLVSGIGAAAVAGVSGLAPLVGLLGGLPAVLGTLGTSMMTFKMLSGGIMDAFKVMMTPGATAQQMSQALNALGPQGALLIGPMQSLAQQMRSIRSSMQGEAYPRFAQAMIAAGPAVSVVGQGLVHMSRAIGDVAANGAKALSSGPWRRDIATIMDRNVTLFRTLASAGGSIADVFRHITVAAGPMVQMLADAFRGAAANLDQWISAKRESGALEGFFTRVGHLALTVGHVLGDFGVGLFNIFKGAAPLSASMGQSLTQIADRFAVWSGSAAGQARIHHFFTQMIPVVNEVGHAIGTIVGGFLKLSDSGNAAALLGGLENVLKLTLAIVTALAKVNQGISKIPVVGGAMSGGLDMLGAMALLGPGRSVLKGGYKLGKWGRKKWVGRAARTGAATTEEGATMAAEAGAGGLAAEAGVGAVAAEVGGGALIGAEAAGTGAAVAAAAIPLAIAAAVVAIAGGIYVLYRKWKPFHDLVNATGRVLKTGVLAAVHAVADAVGNIGKKGVGGALKSGFEKWIHNPLGFRFAGGQVDPGKPYVVGELGPELLLNAGGMKVIGADGPEIIRPDAQGFVVPNHEMEPVAAALAGATRGGDGAAAGGGFTVPIDMRGAQFIGIEDFERRVTAAAIRGVAEARRQKAERR